MHARGNEDPGISAKLPSDHMTGREKRISDFAQIFTLGAEFAQIFGVDHAAMVLSHVVALESGQTHVFCLGFQPETDEI